MWEAIVDPFIKQSISCGTYIILKFFAISCSGEWLLVKCDLLVKYDHLGHLNIVRSELGLIDNFVISLITYNSYKVNLKKSYVNFLIRQFYHLFLLIGLFSDPQHLGFSILFLLLNDRLKIIYEPKHMILELRSFCLHNNNYIFK